MIRILFLFFLFLNISYSCGLCSVFSPLTTTSIQINSGENTIYTLDVKLKLTKEFTDSLIEIYDENQDSKIDEKELENIVNIFKDYAIKEDYFLFISYDKVIHKDKSEKFEINNLKGDIQNGILVLSYEAILNYTFMPNYILHINIEDKNGFFLIQLDKNSIKFPSNYSMDEIIKDNSVSYSFNKIIKSNVQKENTNQNSLVLNEEIKTQESLLLRMSKKVKTLLLEIKNGNLSALFILIVISFLYGMLHALGPGHGKALAFSYFLSHKTSYIKAFMISLSSSMIHIISAFVLVLISFFFLESILNNFVNNSIIVLTKLSAFMIMVLALYLLYKKFQHKESCGCCACHSKKDEWYFVLTSGLIPCPGTVILFIYAFMLQTYFAVLLSSIAIGLGMSVVVFCSSYLGLSIFKMTDRFAKLKNILEIVSPIFMFLLGILLYYTAQNL